MTTNEAKWHESWYKTFRNANVSRARKRKRSEMEAESSEIGSNTSARRVYPQRQSQDKDVCIFCENGNKKLHKFSTLQTDTNVQTMAKDLQDTTLLARIEGGDLIALEAKYHLSCLINLRNRHRFYMREVQNATGKFGKERKLEARALVELLAYIETSVEEDTFL